MSGKDPICRVCLQEGNIPIFGNCLDDVSEDLNSLANIKVTQDDTFPKHLCYDCYLLLQSAIKLRTTAMHSEAKLLESNVANIGTVPSAPYTESPQIYESDFCFKTEKDSYDTEKKMDIDTESTSHKSRQIYKREETCTEALLDNNVAVGTVISESIYLCNDTDEYSYECALEEHIQSEDDDKSKTVGKKEPCQTCGEVVLSDYMKKHISLHGPQPDTSRKELSEEKSVMVNTYRCTRCGISFADKVQDAEHTKSEEHKGRKIRKGEKEPCRICGKVILSYTHDEQNRPKQACQVCGKVILSKYIKSHMSLHDPKLSQRRRVDKNRHREPCPKCGKLYFSTYMRAHLEFHNEDTKRYICAECGKGFKAYSTLYIHQKTHSMRTENFSLKCSQCSYRHWNPKNIKLHERSHTNQAKQYQCAQCQKTFTHKSNLKRHMVTHEECKFECNVCEKSFKSQLSLNDHVKVIHVGGVGGQVCETCGATFILRRKLMDHERIVHKRKAFPPGRRPCYLTSKYQSEETPTASNSKSSV